MVSNTITSNPIKLPSKAEQKRQEVKADLITLRQMIKPGQVIYTVLRSVSRSGMSRRIDLYTITTRRENGRTRSRMTFLSGYVGRVLGYSRGKSGDGLIVGGCGMDMGFHLVYSLGRALFPKGCKAGEGVGRFASRQTGVETDGGYCLQHEWI